jgi:hypothetical protein
MGKDREGKFHPAKGKPSDEGHRKGNDLNTKGIDEKLALEDKYGINTDDGLEVAAASVRHPNRNEDKGKDRSPASKRKSPAKSKSEAHEEKSNEQSIDVLNEVQRINEAKDHYYVLILSKKNAKLFLADQAGIRYMPIDELPNGIEDVVHLEEKDYVGSGLPDDKENIALYLKEVDRTLLKEALGSEHSPLVLGGVEYLVNIYKEVSQYNHIWDKMLTGSLEYENSTELHKQSLDLVQPYFEERKNKALELFGNQSATKLVSRDPKEIVSAAHFARVSHLFVQEGAELFGSFDEQANNISIDDPQSGDAENLRDKAIQDTLANGGEVYIVAKDEMPSDAILAAVMRFEL